MSVRLGAGSGKWVEVMLDDVQGEGVQSRAAPAWGRVRERFPRSFHGRGVGRSPERRWEDGGKRGSRGGGSGRGGPAPGNEQGSEPCRRGEGARANVIHELGYAQGALGWEHAIVLLEEGCQLPSNLAGTVYIEFQEGKPEGAYDWLRKTLKQRQEGPQR